MTPNPALRALPDPIPITDEVQGLLDTIAGLEGLNRKLLRDIEGFKREALAEAEAHKLWPTGLRLFKYHSRVFNRPKALWTPKRFEMVRPILKADGGLTECLQAIAGKQADKWAVEHGKTTWDDIFKDRQKFETCLTLCPKDWKDPR